MFLRKSILALVATALFGVGVAQAVTVSLSRNTITNEAAIAMVQACKAVALENGWPVAIAVVGSDGGLVAYERLDTASVIAVRAAPWKATTSVRWRRPSKVIEERFVQGSSEAVWMADFPRQGGLPIIVDGKAIGAIGVGGSTPDNDEACSMAGLEAVLGPNPPMQESR